MQIKHKVLVRFMMATLAVLAVSCASESTHQFSSNDSLHSSQKLDFEQAFQRLKNGNQRFVSGDPRPDGQSQADVQRLSHGQTPHAIVFSCSDSRVPPELVFDQKLGEIFTVRTAGESLSPTVLASMEYAVVKLATPLIVVLGHTDCGAVTEAFETPAGESAGSMNLDQLVGDIQSRIHKDSASHHSEHFRDEAWANAMGIAQELPKRSKIIADALITKKLSIKVGLYNLSTGQVDFLAIKTKTR